MKLFISYSHKDSPWAKDFWRALRDAPLYHDAWLDERIVPASDWWHSILSEIEACDCFIPLLSPDYNNSIYCMAELEYAAALNKPILPLMLRACTAPEVITKSRVQFKDITANPPMDRVLLIVSSVLAVMRHTDYPSRSADRPDEPKPKVNPRETLQLAEDALEKGNYSLAEKLLQDTVDGGATGVMLRTATRLLEEVRMDRQRVEDYNHVLALHEAGSKRAASAAWREYEGEYGSDYDPVGLKAIYAASRPPIESYHTAASLVVPSEGLTPVNEESEELAEVAEFDPNSPDWLNVMLPGVNVIHEVEEDEPDYMARLHAFTGKRNADWQPYITTFPDLKIPTMEFCLVPPGSFQMGGDGKYDGKPIHPQTLTQPYWLAKYPVTNAHWAAGVKAGAVGPPEEETSLKWYKDPKMADCPVVGVSWFDARQFCAWLDCRLPTEVEWEYAARGVGNLAYPWGEDFDVSRLWYGNTISQPQSVTSKPQGGSWVGALHLSGNVWEWTNSLHQPYPYQADDGREEDAGDSTTVMRMLRGGSFYFDQINARAASRNFARPDNQFSHIGFRVLRYFSSP